MPLTDNQKQQIDELTGDPQLGLSLHGAARKDPDQAAEIVSLADSQRLPVDTVERNKEEVKARHLYGGLDPLEIQSQNPITANYLKDPKNAAVSIDDIPTLRELEDRLKPEHGFWSNTGRGVVSRLNEVVGNLMEWGGTLADEERLAFDPGVIFHEDGISWSWNLADENVVSMLTIMGKYVSEGEAHRVGFKPDFTWEKLKGDITPTNAAGYIIETGAKSLVDMAATIATLPAYVMSRTQEIAEQRVANDLRTDVTTDDLASSFVTATIVSLLERVGAKAVFDVGAVQTLKQVGIAAAEAFAKEAVTEFVQEGIEYYGETLGTRTPVSHLEALDRAFAGLVAGGPMGGGIRGATASVQALTTRVEKNATRTARSMNEQLVLDSYIRLSQDSKTRERAQDRFESFLRATGDRKVMIEAREVLKLIDEGVELPEYMVEQVVGDGDVEIPIDRFAADIVPNEELINKLRPHIRFSSDTLTSTELEAGIDTSIQQLMDKANKSQDLVTEADAIWETVKDQIVATGRQGEQTAKWSAALIPARAVVIADQYDISVTEAFERMNFRVVGPSAAPAAVSLASTFAHPQYRVARETVRQGTADNSDERNQMLDVDEAVGLGRMTPEEGIEEMRKIKLQPTVLKQQTTDAEGNVFEITIERDRVDKKINMIEKLVECMAS